VEDDQDWDLRAFYERYLQRCNEHRFDELGEFVAADVRVNDRPQGLEQYAAGLRAVVSAFPDYRWNLRRLFVEGPWLSAYFTDTGTHRGSFLGVPATGRAVSTVEFAVYRLAEGKIADVWVTADNLGLLEQVR
jgi:predicted ester cyclase